MPSAAFDFVAKCGSFLPVYIEFMGKRAQEKVNMRTKTCCVKKKTTGVLFGFLLCYMFWGSLLLQAGDVELNPGPGIGDKQSSDKTAGSALRQTRLSSAKSSDAAAVPNWTINDLMAKLNTMDSKLDGVTKDVKYINDKLDVLEGEVGQLKRDYQDLVEENALLEQRNEELKGRTVKLEKKVDDLECRSRRNNLLFYGLDKEENETNEDCELRVKELLTDKLELGNDVEFDRVHRLGSKEKSPLIARCVLYKDKVKIMKQKSKLKGTEFYIREDFSAGIRDVRKKLYPFMKAKKEVGVPVSMVYDHLIVNGTKYFLSDDEKSVVPDRFK